MPWRKIAETLLVSGHIDHRKPVAVLGQKGCGLERIFMPVMLCLVLFKYVVEVDFLW